MKDTVQVYYIQSGVNDDDFYGTNSEVFEIRFGTEPLQAQTKSCQEVLDYIDQVLMLGDDVIDSDDTAKMQQIQELGLNTNLQEWDMPTVRLFIDPDELDFYQSLRDHIQKKYPYLKIIHGYINNNNSQQQVWVIWFQPRDVGNN